MNNKAALITVCLLLVGCSSGGASSSSSSMDSSSKEESSIVSYSSESSSSSVSSSSLSSSSTKTSSSTSSTSLISSHSSSSSSSKTVSSQEDDYMKGRPLLPNGYAQIDQPSNSPVQLVTSTDSKDWYNVDWTEDRPSDWRYMYKNSVDNGPSGHKCSPGFYSYDSSKKDKYPGGLKIANPFVGFQSMKFNHVGEKLEIRVYITQVNNASDKPEEKKPIGFLYFFNNKGTLMPSLTYTIEQGSIETSTQYIKCYITGEGIEDVTHFQFWTEAKPFKGKQCYNFGVGKVGIHSWTYA